MKAANIANTDAADSSVIAKFRELTTRFPEDPLAQASTENTAKLEQRISERDAAIQQAQKEVLRLIKTCHDSQASSTDQRRRRRTNDGSV